MKFLINRNKSKIINNKIKFKNINSKINTTIINNHINTSILNKINNKNPTISKTIYSTQNPYTNTFIRNPNCWLNGIKNISCMSPAQMSGASWNTRAGTLISPRHIILAKHYTIAMIPDGTDIKFVDDNGIVVTRKLASLVTDPDNDIAIYSLNEDVTENIKFAKVLPRNHASYFVQGTQTRYSVFLDQEEKALLGINTYLPFIEKPPGYQNVVYVTNPNHISDSNLSSNDVLIRPWYETPISGDSGNPMFLLIDNELVIISCWTTPVSGPSYSSLFNKINSLMNSAGGGYNLTPIDLNYVYNKYK